MKRILYILPLIAGITGISSCQKEEFHDAYQETGSVEYRELGTLDGSAGISTGSIGDDGHSTSTSSTRQIEMDTKFIPSLSNPGGGPSGKKPIISIKETSDGDEEADGGDEILITN